MLYTTVVHRKSGDPRVLRSSLPVTIAYASDEISGMCLVVFKTHEGDRLLIPFDNLDIAEELPEGITVG